MSRGLGGARWCLVTGLAGAINEQGQAQGGSDAGEGDGAAGLDPINIAHRGLCGPSLPSMRAAKCQAGVDSRERIPKVISIKNVSVSATSAPSTKPRVRQAPRERHVPSLPSLPLHVLFPIILHICRILVAPIHARRYIKGTVVTRWIQGGWAGLKSVASGMRGTGMRVLPAVVGLGLGRGGSAVCSTDSKTFTSGRHFVFVFGGRVLHTTSRISGT
ncbi:hypothetical protein DFH09DRAFT_1098192 [Mycena vulgaris]|nr:hypothetical protein DFH09DRAFT_1098192 [Mycena vulgaris]